jgi:hypothetical protein
MPRMRTFGILAGMLLVAAVRAEQIPSEPGYHGNVPLPGKLSGDPETGHGSNSYELYLPKAYRKDEKVRHPVIMVLGNGATQNRNWINERHLTQWAEGVNPPAIVIGVNRLFNAGTGIGFGEQPGEPLLPNEEGLADYLDLIGTLPQAHPTMRFLISWPSGGSGDSQRVTALSLKYPDKIAGYVLGPHPYAYGIVGAKDTTFALRKDISVAVLDVTHESYARGRPQKPYSMNQVDNFDPKLWENAYLVNLRRGGNYFQRIESIDWGQREPSVQEAFWYLVNAGWQVKAGVTEVEKATAKAQALAALEKVAQETDAVAREHRYRMLLAVPGAADWPESRAFIALWRASITPAADARKEPLFRYSFLETTAQHPLVNNNPDALTRVEIKLREVKADPAYIKEKASRDAVRTVAAGVTDQQMWGQDMQGLIDSIVAFEEALKNGEGTLASKEAKAWLDFLKKRYEELRKTATK